MPRKSGIHKFALNMSVFLRSGEPVSANMRTEQIRLVLDATLGVIVKAALPLGWVSVLFRNFETGWYLWCYLVV